MADSGIGVGNTKNRGSNGADIPSEQCFTMQQRCKNKTMYNEEDVPTM